MKTYKPIEFWNNCGKKKFKLWDKPSNYAELDNLIALILDRLSPRAQILDVGCGWGRFMYRCNARGLEGLRIKMCDISQEFIKQCILINNVEPRWWDGSTLPYDDSSFDLVVSQSVMLHIKPGMINRVWKEHVRVAKGHLFVATAIPKLTPERKDADKKPGNFCFAHAYDKLIERNNLEIVDEKFFSDGARVNWLFKKKD